MNTYTYAHNFICSYYHIFMCRYIHMNDLSYVNFLIFLYEWDI
nr:MAG TPA: hypothetical protein [Caudoviricetes sp.]